MFKKLSQTIIDKAEKIKLIGFDVDGVLTDGSICVNDDGEVFKKFHSLDGHGLRLAKNFGIDICIISARKSSHVHARFKGFGFEDNIFTGVANKLECLEQILQKYNLSFEEVAFMGDDSLDVPVLEKVGLAACPPAAHYSVFPHCDYTSKQAGGKGAGRELVDLILSVQGKIPQ